MQNNSPKLLIEINNVELIFVVIERNENDRFSLLYSQKIPNEGVSEKRITDLNLFLRLIKENIYLIEKKLDYIFKEAILIIDNFNCSLISFSGFKTNVLYFLRKQQQLDKNYIQNRRNDLCSSMQHILINILMEKLDKAVIQTGIKEIVIGGGVSANSGLRHALSKKTDWNVYLPPLSFTTDNAAMIAVAGYFKYQNNNFGVLNRQAQSRISL